MIPKNPKFKNWVTTRVTKSFPRMLSRRLPLIFLCVVTANAAPFPPDEIDVIRSIFSLKKEPAKPVEIALSEMTSNGGDGLGDDKQWKISLRRQEPYQKDFHVREATEDFIEKNTEPASWIGLEAAPVTFVFISDKEQHAFFDDRTKNGWKIFFEKYPKTKALFYLSRVGFSKDHQLAIYWTSMHAFGFGTGAFHGLRKTGGVWVEDPTVRVGWSTITRLDTPPLRATCFASDSTRYLRADR